jgi:hypothetical protein
LTRRTARLGASLAVALAAIGLTTAEASGAPTIRYGVQDDAWLENGAGTLESRLDELDRLGVQLVRYTVRWDAVARARPRHPSDPDDSAYDWEAQDRVLAGLRRHGIAPLVTLLGTPRWANGGREPNVAPSSATAFASFARATATRYSWVRHWTIWNEPNQAIWLRPASVRTYVRTLLNPAYEAIHDVLSGALVGGGVTAARGGSAGVAPVPWIRQMGVLGAKLDAYAHHPYPANPRADTPWAPACPRCSTLTMADLERLEAEVRRSLGPKRIWLTEYGYQTNPPDFLLGVSPARQAALVASAARRAYLARSVDILLFFLVRDDASPDGWQSGLISASGRKKPAYEAFRMPFTQVKRQGGVVSVWGQIRPGSRRRAFRIRVLDDGRWSWLGGTRRTDPRGFFSLDLRAPRGSRLQVWAPGEGAYSVALLT